MRLTKRQTVSAGSANKTWQARSFGAKRQQAETLTSPRLLLDGAFPIPPVTQISSVAARCAVAIFPRAAARWSAGSVRSAPANRRRSPCGSAAPASAPAYSDSLFVVLQAYRLMSC